MKRYVHNKEKAYFKLVLMNKLVLLLWFVFVFLNLLKRQLFPWRVVIFCVVSLLFIIDGCYFIFFGYSPLVDKLDYPEKVKKLITTLLGAIMLGFGMIFLIVIFCNDI